MARGEGRAHVIHQPVELMAMPAARISSGVMHLRSTPCVPVRCFAWAAVELKYKRQAPH